MSRTASSRIEPLTPAGAGGFGKAPHFRLPALPYAKSALDPVISARTLGFHYDKHHQDYVTKLNELTKGTELEGETLDHIISATEGKPDKADVFNNAAQVWNHTFYWSSLKPKGGGRPTGTIAGMVDDAFGGHDEFKKQLAEICVGQFGSGWGWLVLEDGKLKLAKTGNADLPATAGQTPLLTIDVWEHAYYLDYQNQRMDYVNAVIEKLLNWDFANDNLARAG